MLHREFTPFPIIQTEQFLLRPLHADDAHAILELRSDESVNKYLDRPKARSLDDAEKFITAISDRVKSNETLYCAISRKEEEGLLGTVCLWNLSDELQEVEIGYELLPRFQGLGIMKEVIPSVLRYAFDELNARKINATLHRENARSINLLGKHGFVKHTEGAEGLPPNIDLYTRQVDKR